MAHKAPKKIKKGTTKTMMPTMIFFVIKIISFATMILDFAGSIFIFYNSDVSFC
jgi:hypothetical protein